MTGIDRAIYRTLFFDKGAVFLVVRFAAFRVDRITLIG